MQPARGACAVLGHQGEYGLDLPNGDDTTERIGAALNTPMDLSRRDPIAGTPWHKHVPARTQVLPA
ncbi:hypothetical protein ACGFNV_34355 [Streptomyces sp. NPDC048751]|uniref:hypothetical protein n=1 Tax=Streptomyces sp. NPDC048751 TaxID=3365591 RepID=UPI00371984B6